MKCVINFKCLATLLICVLFPLSALSDVKTRPPGEPGFYDKEKIPLLPRNVDRAWSATLRTINSCTGFYISNHGHMLTALHCVADCLYARDAIHYRSTDNGLVAVSTAAAPGVLCDGHIEVLAIGGGAVLFGRPPYNHPRATPSRSEWSALTEDFALIRDLSHQSGGARRTPCIPLAKSPAGIGDRLFSIGYPSAMERPNGHSSNGHAGYISYGRLLKRGIDAEIHYPELWHQRHLDYHRSAREGKVENPYSFVDEHFLISDVDTYRGSSGSPMLNSDGHWVGVSAFGTATRLTSGMEITYFSGAVPAEKIVNSIRLALHPYIVSKAFDCQ